MESKKISAKYLIREFLDVLELKRGTPKTFLKILRNPIEVINSYIRLSNKKDGFIGPLRLIFIISIFCVFFNESLKDHKDIRKISINQIPYLTIHGGGMQREIINKYLGNEFLKEWEEIKSNHIQEAKIKRDSVLIEVPENERSEIEREMKNQTSGELGTMVEEYYDSNMPSETKDMIYKAYEFADKIQLTINPFYYVFPIVFLVSCFSYLLFYYAKKSFLEHFIINLYPIGIIFILYGLFGVTEAAYKWISPLTFEKVGINFTLLSFSLFCLERFYTTFYYVNIFGNIELKNFNLNKRTRKMLIASLTVLVYPTFDFGPWIGSDYRGFGELAGMKPYVGFNLFELAIFKWTSIIYYINDIFYSKLVVWIIS